MEEKNNTFFALFLLLILVYVIEEKYIELIVTFTFSHILLHMFSKLFDKFWRKTFFRHGLSEKGEVVMICIYFYFWRQRKINAKQKKSAKTESP